MAQQAECAHDAKTQGQGDGLALTWTECSMEDLAGDRLTNSAGLDPFGYYDARSDLCEDCLRNDDSAEEALKERQLAD